MIIAFLIAFFGSLMIGVLLIKYEHLHHHVTADHDLDGPQKFHATAVPRVGGVPIYIGLLLGLAWVDWKHLSDPSLIVALVAVPAFFGGLADDLTKRVGPFPRLIATFCSAALGYFFLGAALVRVNLPYVDDLLHWLPLLSFVLTLVTVGGVANAINIVDGYNGLSGMVTLLILGGMGFIAFEVGDTLILSVCIATCGAVLGFLIWNYPNGLIFSGDGGAYLMGFMIGELALLLMARNPEVSAWALLLLTIYPVFETLFSVYRRKFLQGRPVGYPDALHLHQMIYRRLVRWMVGSKEAKQKTQRNALTSVYLWFLTVLSVIPAVLFWNSSALSIISILLFVLFYLFIYRRLVRFRAPQRLILRSKSSS
ncbi:MraY family glycosyltransferase [Chitinimonas taiwanensis]|uniref:MraY family glycosyltransferase n=1 Tax=Chitinimonas taiwanensis TaxID=240412 RepID=UPI0035B2918F